MKKTSVVSRRSLLAILGGTAAFSPFSARSQQSARPVIGFIGLSTPHAIATRLTAFRAGLSENGYVEGETVTIEYRYAEGQFDRAPALVAELLARNVTVIVTAGSTPLPRAAMAATKTVPIVFTHGGDPVADGLVASLARPGGNLTGATFYSGELEAKQFELLSELVPVIRVIAVTNPPGATNAEQVKQLRAAMNKGEDVFPISVTSIGDLDGAFATILQHRVDAAIVGDPFSNQQIDRVVAFAAQNRIPAIYGISRIRGGRRSDELRRQHQRYLPPSRHLHWAHSQG